MQLLKEKSTNMAIPCPRYAMLLSECFAKTWISEDGQKHLGRTVFNHCNIVGEVARAMVARMPDWLREKLFPSGSILVAATHDVGKVSPTFQEKIYRAIRAYTRNSKKGLENIDPVLEESWGGHGGVSQLTAKALRVGDYIPEILGQHHGYSPDLSRHRVEDESFGGETWQARREELILELKAALQCDWPEIVSSSQARVLSGLTTVADWVGSSSWFDDPHQSWQPCIKQALDDAGFMNPQLKPDLSFLEIFNFKPHPIQQQFFENIEGSGVYILEAPMGLGKTEAALYAAYKVISTGQATGIYFALPTQLTSNKIHDRVNTFLSKILVSESRHSNALLLHGNAWLRKTDMGVDCEPGGSWFNTNKRGILAPFAVGTVDQALMAVMNIKHGFVRAFGLAGKVVILDEIHSYDAYTGSLLNALIKMLRDLSCTVIILSATLTSLRRQDLLQYSPAKKDYPLISISSNNSSLEIPVTPPANKTIKLQFPSQENDVVNEVLLRAEQGQQILWIENTVEEAQNRYHMLAARAKEIGLACGLLHSRFLKKDREKNEAHWVKLYGKEGVEMRQLQGRILVGTQVLEQSLDIDADFLVTRMCPTDMLLQRLGRLWRHENIRPETATIEAWILAPLFAEAVANAKESFAKTAKVYDPYVLCRSLEVWKDLISVNLPQDIRLLIESTYVDREETDALARYKYNLEQEREKLKRFALVGLSQGGKTLPENKASTRYSEQETVEVLLLHAYREAENKQGVYVNLLGGEEIYLPRNIKSQTKEQWREKAALLMQNTVQIPKNKAPNVVFTKCFAWLEAYIYLGSQEESLLHIAKVGESGELLGIDNGVAASDFTLFYDSESGYMVQK